MLGATHFIYSPNFAICLVKRSVLERAVCHLAACSDNNRDFIVLHAQFHLRLLKGNCTDEVNGYTCNCIAGYTGDRCDAEIDECSSSPCLNNGNYYSSKNISLRHTKKKKQSNFIVFDVRNQLCYL